MVTDPISCSGSGIYSYDDTMLELKSQCGSTVVKMDLWATLLFIERFDHTRRLQRKATNMIYDMQY